MLETLLQIQNHIRVVWRFRWVALISASLLCEVGWCYVQVIPDQFEVTAQVFLDTRSALTPLLKGLAFEDRSRADLAGLLSRTLLNRPNLEEVARKTDLDLKATTPRENELMLARLETTIQVVQTKKDDIFVISYRNTDAKVATRVVDALLNVLVERFLGKTRQDASKSKEFIDDQIKSYEVKLRMAEARLKEFKQKNLGVMPEEGRDYFGRLEAQAVQRAEAELQLEEAKHRRDELVSQLENVDEMFSMQEAPLYETLAANPWDARIEQLEASLDELLLQYTENHPDVVSTRSLIRTLEERKASEQAALTEELPEDEMASGDGEEEVSPQQVENPLFQQLKMTVGDAEAAIAALQTRVDEYKRREEQLKKLIDTSLNVETEYKQLNRDYEIDRHNYQELVERREALKLTEDAGQTTESVQFNIIDPPHEPLVPAFPNRQLLNLIVFLIGVSGGAAIAWLTGMLKPTVYTKQRLQELTELPVLGIVSRLWTPGQLMKRRVEVASFAAGCMCLMVLFVGMIIIDISDVLLSDEGLRETLSRIRERFL